MWNFRLLDNLLYLRFTSKACMRVDNLCQQLENDKYAFLGQREMVSLALLESAYIQAIDTFSCLRVQILI